MIPFVLKVVWFCLAFSGIIACWVVQYVFSQVTSSYWGPVLYTVFATSLEGVICLGMIYDMNPYQMPKTFCILQTVVIYYSAWSLTGICAAFTFATSSPILWPSSTKHTSSTLAWKTRYYVPILIFPLLCLSISIPVLLRINAIQPTDDLYCDASHPEWGRFLGYAGLSIIPTIPCFFVSFSAVRRIVRLHRDNQHASFKNNACPLGSLDRRIVSGGSTNVTLDCPVTPSSRQPLSMKTHVEIPNGSDLSLPAAEWTDAWQVIFPEEDVQPVRTSTSTTGISPLARPNLVPAIWRLVLFQMSFFIIQFLAALSTIIDVAQRRSVPTPFGSQHIAFLLVGWGPALVFGHLPAVRRRLMFWKKYYV